ncbi:hypothetical protein GCM10009416_49800 [Craurococcus roseus]|uniref:Uncharacterized protein n=1 Tax=Craurococcus roseus TaxID=77585 RepID=A0ABN1G9F7_9PROT
MAHRAGDGSNQPGWSPDIVRRICRASAAVNRTNVVIAPRHGLAGRKAPQWRGELGAASYSVEAVLPRFHRSHERERFACDDRGFFMSSSRFADTAPQGLAAKGRAAG